MAMQRFDAVSLDINFPSVNGLDWLQVLREIQLYLAIIIISGIGDILTAVEAMSSGDAHFLTKSLNLDALLLFLKDNMEVEHLRRRKSASRCLLTDKSIYICKKFTGWSDTVNSASVNPV